MFTVTKGYIAKAMGISPTSVTNWASGQHFKAKTQEKIFQNMREKLADSKLCTAEEKNALIELFNKLESGLNDSSMRVYEYGQLLEHMIPETQRIIDEVIYKYTPVFRDIYYETNARGEHRAQEHFKEYGGIYYAYFARRGFTIQGTLNIRYLLKLSHHYALRVKVNVPRIEDARYFEYDGFVAIKTQKMFFSLEERQHDRADFLYIIVDTPMISSQSFSVTGKYMTVGQNREQPIVAESIILKKASEFTGSAVDFMHSECKILRGVALHELE